MTYKASCHCGCIACKVEGIDPAGLRRVPCDGRAS